mgnify:FL=1
MEIQIEAMALLVFQIGLLSGVVKLALNNIQKALDVPGYWHEGTIAGCIVLSFLFDVQVLGTILKSSQFTIGAYVDYIVSGATISGGAGAFAKIIRKAAADSKVT